MYFIVKPSNICLIHIKTVNGGGGVGLKKYQVSSFSNIRYCNVYASLERRDIVKTTVGGVHHIAYIVYKYIAST